MTEPLSHAARATSHDAADGEGPPQAAGGGEEEAAGALPDLSEVDLETLRTLDHPVLTEMVAELRERAERPREMLWGFTSSPF
ncbi:FxSxx-COOH cyclophane-containing RiPP peptide [Streptomyces sp. NRRL F-5126]|uniref:FxSxx-COOH cyclophane-containing RiPP peptide n=1 Tax=Streptomyces sp. NRRL F-5126 TaxID=1463857 RepID=UPI00056B17C0|nr:FxSxx-COOH cyclophane-containing RiPP peptide [Streptomyces sp. NRRL F-5126]